MKEQKEQSFWGDALPDMSKAKTYRKRGKITAVRIEGPFVVYTNEGPVRCSDGYLTVDSRGYPDAISKEKFEKLYEEAWSA